MYPNPGINKELPPIAEGGAGAVLPEPPIVAIETLIGGFNVLRDPTSEGIGRYQKLVWWESNELFSSSATSCNVVALLENVIPVGKGNVVFHVDIFK